LPSFERENGIGERAGVFRPVEKKERRGHGYDVHDLYFQFPDASVLDSFLLEPARVVNSLNLGFGGGECCADPPGKLNSIRIYRL
jgi:hypothetical protein